MTGKDHANLIGIFSYVFAGIQGLMTFFFAAYAIIMGVLLAMAAVNGDPNDAGGLAVIFVIAAVFGLISALGLFSIVQNIKLGRKLRSGTPPSERSVKFVSILNICSLFYGGMFSLPFGAALGAYTLWFATSDLGRRYFAGIPDPQTQYMNPPPAQVYTETNAYRDEPYRWR